MRSVSETAAARKWTGTIRINEANLCSAEIYVLFDGEPKREFLAKPLPPELAAELRGWIEEEIYTHRPDLRVASIMP